MKTNVEELQDNQVKLTVTIDEKEIDDRIKKAYKDFASKYNVPGFRRGKAPRPVIDNLFGHDAVLATVTDDVIKEYYPLAVDEAGLSPISNPEIEDKDALVAGGKPFTFTAKLTKKPELELSSYGPIEIELPPEELTEDEISLQIDSMREHYYEFVDAKASTKIEEGGYAEVSIATTDDKGEAIDSVSYSSRLVVLGSAFYPPEFDAELIGLKKGQKAEFDLEFKGLYTTAFASLAGAYEKVHLVVEVLNVKEKVLPGLTDEWAQECGFESYEALRAGVVEKLAPEKKEAYPSWKENACLVALAQRLEGEVPELMTGAAETDLYQRFFQQLQSQDLTMDVYLSQYGITMEQFRDDIKAQALENTRQDLALDAWMRHKGATVSDEQIYEEFVKSGAEDPKALLEEWSSSGRMHELREGISRSMAVDEIIESAVVSELGASKPVEEKPAEKKPRAKKASTGEPAEKAATKAAPVKKASPKSEKGAPAE